MNKVDIRAKAARYYDYNPETPEDVPFYQNLIPSPTASILELGCGTGRVTVPLAGYCQYIHGIDLSPAMISICQEKLSRENIPLTRARVEVGDITRFALGRRFDFIIAPFRVFQNLGTDAQVDGLFQCIHNHLSPGGTCILNVFRPSLDPEELRERWVSQEEKFNWEVVVEGRKLVCSDRRPRMDRENFILYPELIYRLFEGDSLVDEVLLELVMRCYYPDEFMQRILEHDFRIIRKWGGYKGEEYGEGPELVIQFSEGEVN